MFIGIEGGSPNPVKINSLFPSCTAIKVHVPFLSTFSFVGYANSTIPDSLT